VNTAVVGTPTYRSALAEIIESTIAPQAREIDAAGSYPRAGLEALGKAGILGLLSSPEVGGAGESLAEAAEAIEKLSAACGSTAMVLLMHYAAVSVLETHRPREVRAAIAAGEHVSTLAFSESGSRSHFWAPLGTASADGDSVRLDAAKSWVTSAGEADSYVWSSRPLAGDGMTLWLVRAESPGLSVAGAFDGLGLRGNASRPMTGAGLTVPPDARLGEDGAGLDIALGVILPHFLVLSAALSLGVMEAMIGKAAEHLTGARLEHLGVSLTQQPLPRAEFARLRTRVDEVRAFLTDTLGALGSGRADATLRVLQVKAVAGEAASEVGDGVMKLCGGAAFRKDAGWSGTSATRSRPG